MGVQMSTVEVKRVLKANDIRSLGSKIVFNYEDLQKRCDDYVDKVRTQTQKMIIDAQAETESIRKQAFEEAKQAGYEEGMRNSEQEIEQRAAARADQMASEKLNTVLPAMRTACEELSREHDRWLRNWESTAIELSVRIAEKLLRQELTNRPDTAVEMIRAALELATGSSHIELRLNPRDQELLGTHAEDVIKSMAACSATTIIADESISRGGCVVSTQHGVVDAKIETLLARITSELNQDSE